MFEDINQDRRRFLSAAAVTLAAAELSLIASANAQSAKVNSTKLPRPLPCLDCNWLRV